MSTNSEMRIKALQNPGQLDIDGVAVSISRQALEEAVAIIIAANLLADRCENQSLTPMCRDALLAYREACK